MSSNDGSFSPPVAFFRFITWSDARTEDSVEGGVLVWKSVISVLIELIEPAETLCSTPPPQRYVIERVVFLGDIPKVCVVRKLFGSTDKLENVLLRTCALETLKSKDATAAQDQLSSLPDPNLNVVLPVFILLNVTNLFGACNISILNGVSERSVLLFSIALKTVS